MLVIWRGAESIFEVYGGGLKFDHKSEKGDKNSINYMEKSSTPSTLIINNSSLRRNTNSLGFLVALVLIVPLY